MNKPSVPPEVLKLWEEPLSAEEFASRLAQARAELETPEFDRLLELIQWFQRRYPTPLARLRYDRKKRLGSRRV